jgi:hypothetical protein
LAPVDFNIYRAFIEGNTFFFHSFGQEEHEEGLGQQDEA